MDTINMRAAHFREGSGRWTAEGFQVEEHPNSEHGSMRRSMELLESTVVPNHGLHGVLRYGRETKELNVNLLPGSEDEPSVWCEFCGNGVKPPLDLQSTQKPEDFCCARYRELFEEVAQQSRFIQERSAGFLRGHISDEKEEQKLTGGQWMREELRLQVLEMEKYNKEPGTKPPSANNSLYTINFKLSACVPADVSRMVREDCRKEQEPECFEHHSTDESGPARFGLCQHQDGSGFILKFYSTGNKFLTAFPDGSGQVFYPSGNLALIILTDNKESVCVVHDDVMPRCPIRALFQSSGKATCYHSNGSIWLSMDVWGGQSLDEGGARTRKWTWIDHAHNPTPLRPIYLSLNKHVGVRVLGRERVFVSFLASGQQARFSVGSFTKPGDCALRCSEPSLCKEELMAQVIQLHVRLALARSRWCLRSRSDSEHRCPRLPPALLSMRKRLLRLSSSVVMEDKDRDFIEHCLQDCL